MTKELESDIQNAICEYLTIKKHYFWRTNNIPVFDPRKKVFHKMPKYSIGGVSDLILLKNGVAYFLEVKRRQPKTHQTQVQKEFEKNVKNNGCVYAVVRSVDDVIKLFINK